MLIVMQKLIEELNIASDKYYNTGSPVMSDKEFDAKLDTLKELEQRLGIVLANSPTQNVGAPVLDELNKIDISDKPMLSLNKCHTVEEISTFAKGQNLVASVKCDGLSVRIIYEDGEIISANTRGNGEIGQDITEHIKHFINVPLAIPTRDRLVVDGEAVILKKDFDEINADGEFKNPRNLASGTLASLDTSLCTSRRLSFILWDVIEFNQPVKLYSDVINFMNNYGFTIVPNETISANSDFEIVNNKIKAIAERYGIPMDGVVYKYNDVTFDTTKTAKFFNNGIAFKFKDEEVETRLKYIDYDVSRNGVLTPVAVFEPVELEGTVVERASLHNLSIMEKILGEYAYSGQKLTIYKANQIIPQVKSAVKMKYVDIVKNGGVCVDGKIDGYLYCPSCETATVVKESEDGIKTIYCPNEQCTCRFINRLDHFCGKSGLDIKGLSRQTLEKLEQKGWLNRFNDVFTLCDHDKEWKALPGFGDKSVSRILDAVDVARNTTLDKFITALGIPLIGSTVAKTIAKKCDYDWDVFRTFVYKDPFSFDEWDGFGPEMNKALKNFDYTDADELIENYIILQKEVMAAATESLKGKTFVITGKLSKSRDKIKADIEAAGGKVTGSVSGKTNYLVCNDKSSTTGKSADAVKLGVPVITEEELMEMLNAK